MVVGSVSIVADKVNAGPHHRHERFQFATSAFGQPNLREVASPSVMPDQPIQERIEGIRESQKIDDDGQRDQDEKGLGAISDDFPGPRHSATVDLGQPSRPYHFA